MTKNIVDTKKLKMNMIKDKNKKCKVCQGYGMWAIGLYSSMGPMDASSGYPTLPCPECKANANPIDENGKK